MSYGTESKDGKIILHVPRSAGADIRIERPRRSKVLPETFLKAFFDGAHHPLYLTVGAKPIV